MKTIWKFSLAITDHQRIEMPKRAKILTVQCQGEQVCLWAIVDVNDGTETEMRTFDIYGTGNPLPDLDLMVNTLSYISTFQQPPFVWHVFEIV